jgi:hypothetical protein
MKIDFSIDTASPADLQALAIIAAAFSDGSQTVSGSGAPVVKMDKPGTTDKPKANAPAVDKPKAKDDGKPPTLEEVRAAVIAKSANQSKKPAIKELLSTFGADKVTTLEAKDYKEFLSQLENV